MSELPIRKVIRLKDYDYSQAGCYFVTMCVKDGRNLLGTVVETTAPGRPVVKLTPLGRCEQKKRRYLCTAKR